MHNLKENEVELIQLINFFSGRVKRLTNEGKLRQEHIEVSKACDHLVAQLNSHAYLREQVIVRREELKTFIKENVFCPSCGNNVFLDQVEVKSQENGWKLNNFTCSECYHQFTRNIPGNPSDMVHYMLEYIKKTEAGLKDETKEDLKEKSELILVQTRKSLDKLMNIIAACDMEFEKMQIKDAHMDSMIKDFKSYLLKEKMEAEIFY